MKIALRLFGAEVNKKKAGTIGDFSCFSFHAQKNLTTLGEGGAVYVKQTELAKKGQVLDTMVMHLTVRENFFGNRRWVI